MNELLEIEEINQMKGRYFCCLDPMTGKTLFDRTPQAAGQTGKRWCLGPESNRHDSYLSRDFKSLASTNFATEAVDGSLRRLITLLYIAPDMTGSAERQRQGGGTLPQKPCGLQAAGALGMVFKKPLKRLVTWSALITRKHWLSVQLVLR